MGPCNGDKRRICAEEGESVSIVKRRKRGSERVYSGVAEEEIYPAIEVTTNGASIFCRKEEWKETNSTRLQIFE